MPKFVGTPVKSKGRGGRLWNKARASVLARETECWICANKCDDFSWPTNKMPFDSAIVDKGLVWPHPGSASVDHVVPISQLAADDPRLWSLENLRLSHLKCNSARGNGVVNRKELVATKTSRNWLA